MAVALFDTATPLQGLRAQIDRRIAAVLDGGRYILGPEVAAFERELARYLGVTERELLEARRADVVFHVYSLDAPLSERDDSSELADVLGAEDDQVEHTVDMEAVTAHWKELPAREQRILLLRFYGNLTQTEIGERLGISQMHVSRLLARALGYLRRCLAGREDEAERDDIPRLPGALRTELPATAGQHEHTIEGRP